jgi:glycosyltransferase involved in cell wall biosynthesis
MISAIIPSHHPIYLQKTIDELLNNARGEVEVIAVLDGYWTKLNDDKRVRIVHLGKNRGMRGAINAGVLVSRGKYIMRIDEHCMFGDGYDTILSLQCEENWIVTAKRYFLDPVQWKVMDDQPPVEHEKLVIQGGVKFAGQRWASRDEEQKDVPISETMAMQGSMWCMHRTWWDKVIGELQTEGYGPLIQDSHEMVFKTWKAGGKLMVNKNTWFSHKHRSFSRTHNNGTKENPANCEQGYKYALDVWREYYEKEIIPRWRL